MGEDKLPQTDRIQSIFAVPGRFRAIKKRVTDGGEIQRQYEELAISIKTSRETLRESEAEDAEVRKIVKHMQDVSSKHSSMVLLQD